MGEATSSRTVLTVNTPTSLYHTRESQFHVCCVETQVESHLSEPQPHLSHRYHAKDAMCVLSSQAVYPQTRALSPLFLPWLTAQSHAIRNNASSGKGGQLFLPVEGHQCTERKKSDEEPIAIEKLLRHGEPKRHSIY